MIYGNTPKTLKRVVIVGLVLAAVLYLVFMIAAATQGGLGALRHAFGRAVLVS